MELFLQRNKRGPTIKSLWDGKGIIMKTRMPITVKISSLIWLVYGLFLLIGATGMGVLIFYFVFRLRSYGLRFIDSVPFVLMILYLVTFSYIFIRIGWQTLKGKARDVFGSSIGSILYGSLWLLGILYLFLKGKYTLNPHLIVGFFLLLAGILALIGRKQYKEWISSNR